MTCSICGSELHTRSHCPLEKAMKRAVVFASLLTLSGCAGLQTDWVLRLQMQYSTPSDTPAAKPAPQPASAPEGKTA